MREIVAEILACPCCGGHLALEEEYRDKREIRAGKLVCVHCHWEAPVSEGIVDARGGIVGQALREIQGNRRVAETERAAATDEWLLRLPESYREIYPHKKPWWENERQEFEQACSMLGGSYGGRVLDLAAGTTWTTNELALRGWHGVALDVSEEKYVGLRSAESFMNASGAYYDRVLADMNRRLPFRDGVFDAVACFGAIHHANALEMVMREIARVMRPGGRFVVVDASRGLLESAATFGLHERETYGLNEQKLTYWQYRRAARQAGLGWRVEPAFSFFAKMDGLSARAFALPATATVKHRIGQVAARTLWRIPGTTRLARAVYPAICATAGAQMVALGRKMRRR